MPLECDDNVPIPFHSQKSLILMCHLECRSMLSTSTAVLHSPLRLCTSSRPPVSSRQFQLDQARQAPYSYDTGPANPLGTFQSRLTLGVVSSPTSTAAGHHFATCAHGLRCGMSHIPTTRSKYPPLYLFDHSCQHQEGRDKRTGLMLIYQEIDAVA